MKKSLLLILAVTLVFAGCQKKYVRPEIQKEDQAFGTEIRYGLSNCYVAYTHNGQPDTSIVFDVKAYPVNELNFTTFSNKENLDAPAADSAALVWRDQKLVLDSNNPVLFDSATKQVGVNIASGYGNAVVAIYHKGEMLWSFHIWKPSVDPDSTIKYSIIGADAMPLNLGAVIDWDGLVKGSSFSKINDAAGLYYQWGRKDPLGRPNIKTPAQGYQTAYLSDGKKVDWKNDIAKNETAYDDAKNKWKEAHVVEFPDPTELEEQAMNYIHHNAGNIIRDWSLKHPTTLIYGTQASYMTFNMTTEEQWKNTKEYGEQYHKYWYEIKNAYDPCPEGYMLPPIKLFRGFISASTYVVDDDGEGSNNFSVSTYEGINADATTKSKMATYGGFNFLCFGALDSSKTSFYPAAGYRLGYDAANPGALTKVGEMGRYCGYTSTTSYIRIFYFEAGKLSAQYGYNPSQTANQIRCIKEMSFSEDEE